MVESKPRSIVGVMADVARINIGTYRCEQCTVWGIDEEEHAAFAKHGVEIHPRSGISLISQRSRGQLLLILTHSPTEL